nr:MAG TPA: helix-turn-helix domain protein [Caudoviricetes sp.]
MKLTDRQRKQIKAEYLSGESKASLAKKFQVSHTAISKILNDEKVSESFKKQIEENTLSMAQYLNSRLGLAQSLLDDALKSIQNKIEKASVKENVALIKALTEAFKDVDKIPNEQEKINLVINLKDTSGENKDG